MTLTNTPSLATLLTVIITPLGDDDREPTAIELAEIAAEEHIQEAELAIVDAEIRLAANPHDQFAERQLTRSHQALRNAQRTTWKQGA